MKYLIPILLLFHLASFGQRTVVLSFKGTDSVNVIGDYSSAVTAFFFRPKSDQVYSIEGLIVTISGQGKMSPCKYGVLERLTNGIRLVILDKRNNVVNEITGTIRIRSNGDWASACFDYKHADFGTGMDDEYFYINCAASRDEVPIYIDRTKKIAVLANDDFTGLSRHLFVVQMRRIQ